VADSTVQWPRSAYVHVPFCRHRCGYCNFTLVAGRDDLVDDYLRAIALEIARRTEGAQSAFEVDTLYFGGGTPTYLKPVQLHRLADAVFRAHPLAEPSPGPIRPCSPQASVKERMFLGEPSPSPSLKGRETSEFTVEANPADLNSQMVETLSGLGVTRVSLGGQSFREEKLRLLERDHDANCVRRAVDLARGANMQVALDLIFATPGESLDQWAADLEAAVSLEPDHISTYGLTFERGTSFWSRRLRGELTDVDEELQREMYALAIDRLSGAGYEHYEVSNFARPGCRSRHNQVYWSGDGYFAYGPGAASFIRGVREMNHRSTTTYIKRVLAGESAIAEREELPPEARARELLVFGLRRIEGVSRTQFRARAGIEIDELATAALHKFTELGLLADDGDRIRLTREGLFVSDAIWPELL
jgi:oxygen-independent coproporphyrinogen-3 oxidase